MLITPEDLKAMREINTPPELPGVYLNNNTMCVECYHTLKGELKLYWFISLLAIYQQFKLFGYFKS